MTTRMALLAALLLVAPALAEGKKGDGQKKLKAALAAAASLDAKAAVDDPKVKELGEAIDAVAADNDEAAAKALMSVLSGTLPSAAAEVFAADRARSGLISMNATEARDEVRKALEKSKKNPRLALLLADVVGGWPDEASAKALGTLLGEKDEQIVVAAATGIGMLRKKEGVRPLIGVFDAWKAKGGTPIEAIGGALFKITGQGFQTQEDWTKWWDGEEATFDPGKVGAASGGTKTKSFQPQKPPSLFKGLELTSRKVVIIVDVSGSMHIKNFVHDPLDEVIPPKPRELKEGSNVREPPPADDPAKKGAAKDRGPPLPPGVNPDDPNYKKKPCDEPTNNCPARRENKCPSDDNLPEYYNRLQRLVRQVVTAVKNFDEDVKFNLVSFSTDARLWKGPKGLVQANQKNKDEAVKWLEALRHDGVTNSDRALTLAFEQCWEADSIVFVTDGAPTDGTGKPLDDKGWRLLLDEVKRLNRTRKVRVDVITMAEGNTGFATGLAAENGGQYITVP